VVNSHLVCDPTIRQLGFDLPRQQWTLLNHFRTEQGHCSACTSKWRLTVSLWRDSDDVSHCRILSPDKTERRLISATLCRWRRCFVADQLQFMARIREEEEVMWKAHHFRHFTSQHCKVSKSEVFEKVTPAADFWISADDMCQKL